MATTHLMSDKSKRVNSMLESLTEQTFFISEEYARELRNSIVPVKILNSEGKIVDRAFNKHNAKIQIKKRVEAIILLGHQPKKYEIVSPINNTSEYSNMKKEEQNLNGLSDTDKVNVLFEKYKDKFPNSFLHTTLWNLFVKKTRPLTDAAFTPIIQDGHTIVGIADRGIKGYTPTMLVFETHNYDEASDICDELNQDVFGVDQKEAFKIIANSM